MGTVGILGAGSWGTALALVAARAGHRVRLWARDPAHVEEIRRTRRNERRLPGIELPAAIEPVSDAAALLAADAIVLAVPAQQLRGALTPLTPATAPLVIAAKGIERGSGHFLSEVVAEVCKEAPVAALSGPSFAAEVARGLPTAVTIAAGALDLARALAGLLALPTFRPYASDDLLGVEVGGALKNVVAIAAGVVMGKGLGENARAAVVTRGLAEIARLGKAIGAKPETLMGLSGLGDLVLTATSLTSRNTAFGHALGRGVPAPELLRPGAGLAEGAWTAEAACAAGARHGLELPIADAVRRVVAGDAPLDEVIAGLLARPLRESE